MVICSHSLYTHRKRKRKDQEHDDQPYIKKPLNAFMLFMKEQRPNVVADLNITDSATVNTIMGQRVSVCAVGCHTNPLQFGKKKSVVMVPNSKSLHLIFFS